MDIQEKFRQYPQAIAPFYSTPRANAPVFLFEGGLFLTQDKHILPTESGRLEYSWLPTPTLRFRVPIANGLPEPGEADLTIADLNVTVDAIVTSVSMSNSEPVQYEGILTKETNIATGLSCERVIFHLPNFTQFLGVTIRNTNATQIWHGRLTLTYSDWIINIDGMREGREIIESVKREGGFAITHGGMLERSNGDSFAYQDGLPLLEGVRYFCSFARGLWCGPILPLGFAASSIVWRQWGAWHLSPWKTVSSWFPFNEIQQLSELNQAFCGLMARLSDPLWSDPIKIAIHWFVEANLTAGGVEGAIVLTQTALELLGWVYLVEDPNTASMSAQKFNGLNAEDKIRALLTQLQVPMGIPAALTSLFGYAVGQNMPDGPSCIVRLRNGIIHPKLRKRILVLQTPRLVRSEAQALGLWFLELVLLKLFDYNGVYYPRFLHDYPANIKTKVPWS